MREKEYLQSYVEFGEDHPNTIKLKTDLNNSVNKFENLTGIVWPFK